MAKTSTPTTVKLTLRLSELLYDQLAERAAKRGQAPETEIARHLEATREYNSTSPIYLTDDARNALSQIAGRMLRTPEDVLAWAKSVSSIKVAGIDVELSDQLLNRLRSRTFGRSFEEHVQRSVVEQLEQLVGMR